MTYKGREYGEKDEHKLMKAVIAKMKSYNNEQERKRKQSKEMNMSKALEGRKGNVSDVSTKIDLVMAADRNESKEINNHNETCVEDNDITQKGAEIMPDVDIEKNAEQERWDYTNDTMNGKEGNSALMKNTNRIEC